MPSAIDTLDNTDSLRLFEQAAEAARVAFWVYDEANDKAIVISDLLYEMLEIPVVPPRTDGSFDDPILHAIHPDDLKRYIQTTDFSPNFEKMYGYANLPEDDHYSIDYRVILRSEKV